MKEKETGKMKNQNNTAQSAGKKSFLQKKNVEISFKRYAIDAMGAMALGLFASLLIGTIIKTLAENVGTTGSAGSDYGYRRIGSEGCRTQYAESVLLDFMADW